MKLTKKLTISITTLLATFCAVFGLATLKPSKAFAATENSVARFENFSCYAFNGTPQKVDSHGIYHEWKMDNQNYYDNIRIDMEFSLWELEDVKTGLESYDKDLTYSALVDSSSSFNKLETVKIRVDNFFKTKFIETWKSGVSVEAEYNPTTVKPLIYVYSDPWEIIDLKTYFENLAIEDREEFAMNGGMLPIYVKTQSPNVKYVLSTKVDIESYAWENAGFTKLSKCTGDNPFKSVSHVKSVAEILNKQVEDNWLMMPMLPDEMAENYIMDAYNNLVANALERTYTVEYLVPIAENVPFAKKESKEITLKLSSDGVFNAVDICKQVGVDYFEIFDTIYNDIKQKDNVLTVQYPCDLWLTNKTVDGETTNHFLNINESYQEYFHRFVENGVFSQGIYEYLYASAIGNVYPEIATQGLSYGDVYGYWDYVVMPKTQGLASILKDVLGNNDKTIAGITKEYHFEDTLTYAGYDKLLNEYHYSYLSRIWNETLQSLGMTGPYTAVHYLLICDPLLKDSIVDESGGDPTNKDPDGGKGQQAVQDINGWLGGMVEDLKGLGSDFTAVISGRGTAGQYVAFGAAGLVVLGVFVFIFMARTGQLGSFTSSRGKNNGKRKKK